MAKNRSRGKGPKEQEFWAKKRTAKAEAEAKAKAKVKAEAEAKAKAEAKAYRERWHKKSARSIAFKKGGQIFVCPKTFKNGPEARFVGSPEKRIAKNGRGVVRYLWDEKSQEWVCE